MAASEDDAELLRRIAGGDVAAFETIFARYHAPLCGFVARFVASPAEAQEVVQELFLDLWTQRGRWRVTGTPRGYLYAAARNRALKRVRHERVARRWAAGESLDERPGGLAAPPPADTALEAEEQLGALREAVAGLPERSRLAVVLRWQEQMSHREVAEAMGISVKGVEKLLTGAMRALRRVLGEGA